MSKYDDPFKGMRDAYLDVNKYDNMLKGQDPYREIIDMKEMAAAANASRIFREEADMLAARQMKDLISPVLDFHGQIELAQLASSSYTLDITRNIKDISAAVSAVGSDQFRLAASGFDLPKLLAQAVFEPVPNYLADWLNTKVAAHGASNSEQIKSVLERLTGPYGVAFAARVVVGEDAPKAGDRSAVVEKRSVEEDNDSKDEREDQSGDVSEPSPAYSELALPEEVQRRLQLVEYIPIEIHRKIARDQKALYELSPRQFEEYVADLLSALEFENINLTPSSGDGGRDLVATKSVNNISLIFAFECKRYAPERRIGPQIMRALLGTVKGQRTSANVGVLVTTSYFTKGSRELIITEPLLDGKDFDDLAAWVREFSQKMKL